MALSQSHPAESGPEGSRAIPHSWWWNGLIGLAVVAALPFVAHALRGQHSPGCEWDGLPLEPIYRVRIVERSGTTHEFCSVRCAELWLQESGSRPVRILVTDETSGAELDAATACYVRSTVATSAVTGNRVHVFSTDEAASRHAAGAHGRRLVGSERPFATMRSADPGSP